MNATIALLMACVAALTITAAIDAALPWDSIMEDAAGVPLDPAERERVRVHNHELQERLTRDDDGGPITL